MTELLKRAFALAEQRSEDEQQALAALLLEEMQVEEEWRALLADPRSTILLERLVDEALSEDLAGETETITGERFV
jgi:hypothetical protein